MEKVGNAKKLVYFTDLSAKDLVAAWENCPWADSPKVLNKFRKILRAVGFAPFAVGLEEAKDFVDKKISVWMNIVGQIEELLALKVKKQAPPKTKNTKKEVKKTQSDKSVVKKNKLEKEER
eukprot:TRINITY_DN6356_c0_g5_i1.p2 TRINITY_DN6356_c0_g5~~TRINITY_DN6356_c0_g5_i1.p2  ORF type:complete len:121 (-),score=30.92 TRINITY_DN6356_c0_g5_i1:301-663(-)